MEGLPLFPVQTAAGNPAERILTEAPPALPTERRVAYTGARYFEAVLPLLLRPLPEGLEVARLFHAMRLLTDATLRRKEARRYLGEAGQRWAGTFTESHRWEDAIAGLTGELALKRIRGVARLRLAEDAEMLVERPWLAVDAWMALRLALAAEAPSASDVSTRSVQGGGNHPPR